MRQKKKPLKKRQLRGGAGGGGRQDHKDRNARPASNLDCSSRARAAAVPKRDDQPDRGHELAIANRPTGTTEGTDEGKHDRDKAAGSPRSRCALIHTTSPTRDQHDRRRELGHELANEPQRRETARPNDRNPETRPGSRSRSRSRQRHRKRRRSHKTPPYHEKEETQRSQLPAGGATNGRSEDVAGAGGGANHTRKQEPPPWSTSDKEGQEHSPPQAQTTGKA